ncbi:unnamed protein product [Dibothriocephalus latus]|uniref:Serine-tRNA synthetase type1 N-terminal domain-containing protein n=1 Tax=Dibothriocephalus latus TaxID=60516 RepID=A0A3P6QIZ2_DIBLA|nr:unnamed protein product [Dibothriocephalus latus]
MVLSIDLFRVDKGGDPEKVRDSQRKRYKNPEDVDKIIDFDNQWRKGTYNVNFNVLSKLDQQLTG